MSSTRPITARQMRKTAVSFPPGLRGLGEHDKRAHHCRSCRRVTRYL